jgi:hypothetical protein
MIAIVALSRGYCESQTGLNILTTLSGITHNKHPVSSFHHSAILLTVFSSTAILKVTFALNF